MMTDFRQGYHDRPRPSGYAIYRAWFDAEERGVDTDPRTDFLCKDGDVMDGWIGKFERVVHARH